MMNDKGLNEVRINLTDLAINVIRMVMSDRPKSSMNSIVRDITDDWARNLVMEFLQQRETASMTLEKLKRYGVDPELVRQEEVRRLITPQKP
jgi:hypothetical protein